MILGDRVGAVSSDALPKLCIKDLLSGGELLADISVSFLRSEEV